MKTLRQMFRGALAEARDVAWFWSELIGRGGGTKVSEQTKRIVVTECRHGISIEDRCPDCPPDVAEVSQEQLDRLREEQK